MADHYAKIWASILDSSIWSEPVEHRVVWVTMLTMSDKHGFVGASIDGLARRANLSIEATRAALDAFMRPDPNSRNKDNDGRRVEEVPRGWHILNYAYFRDLRDAEARKEYERVRKAEQRQRTRRTTVSQDVPDSVGHDRDSSGTAGTDGLLSPMSAPVSVSVAVGEKRAPRSARALAIRPDDVSAQVWEDYTALRKANRAPVTTTVIEGIQREATAAGISLEQALKVCVERGWKSFRADWESVAKGRQSVARQSAHIPNMPIGHATCACPGCVSYRTKKMKEQRA